MVTTGTPTVTIATARRWAGQGLLAIALAILVYGTAGMIGGAISTNTGWRAPAAGIPVFVESNGIHVGLIVPKRAAGIDWRRFAPASDLADPRYGKFDHLAIGWGERGFFLGTPTWADVRPGPILHAAVGSDATLLHVEHIPRPTPSSDVRMILLRPDEYRRLAAFIGASIAAGGSRAAGYGGDDVFYQARGRYDVVHDCNAWVGDALRAAGVRVGWWTPFPVTVLGWFATPLPR